MEKSKIDQAIIDGFHVDEEGYKEVKTIDIQKLIELGIEDIPSFLQGLLDAENNKDFDDSKVDYVKGYRYGKTGKF